jgi:hypothetical protein
MQSADGEGEGRRARALRSQGLGATKSGGSPATIIMKSARSTAALAIRRDE